MVRRPGLQARRPADLKVRPTYLLSIAALAVGVAITLHAQTPSAVKDKVYTKDQADRGEKTYKQVCAKCHLFDGPVTKEGPPLGGDVFLTKWDGKTVFEMAVGIKLNMPPDGSVFFEDDDTAALVAFILKSNGFPAGDKPLKTDASAKNLIIVKK